MTGAIKRDVQELQWSSQKEILIELSLRRKELEEKADSGVKTGSEVTGHVQARSVTVAAPRTLVETENSRKKGVEAGFRSSPEKQKPEEGSEVSFKTGGEAVLKVGVKEGVVDIQDALKSDSAAATAPTPTQIHH